jgi:hypothetical protein
VSFDVLTTEAVHAPVEETTGTFPARLQKPRQSNQSRKVARWHHPVPFPAKPIQIQPCAAVERAGHHPKARRQEIATIQSTVITKRLGSFASRHSGPFVGRMDSFGMAGLPNL